jgi:hypothetical protein
MQKIVSGEAYGDVRDIAGSYLGVGTGYSEVMVLLSSPENSSMPHIRLQPQPHPFQFIVYLA